MIQRDQWKDEFAALTLLGANLLSRLELDLLAKLRDALKHAVEAREIPEAEPRMFSDVCVASWGREIMPLSAAHWSAFAKGIDRACAEGLPALARVFTIALNIPMLMNWEVLRPIQK